MTEQCVVVQVFVGHRWTRNFQGVAADLGWLQEQGHAVERFNLAHDPAQFTANAVVQKMLSEEGIECLPLILVDGQVVSRSSYPTRDNLAHWTETKLQAKSTLPMADGGCCGSSGCC